MLYIKTVFPDGPKLAKTSIQVLNLADSRWWWVGYTKGKPKLTKTSTCALVLVNFEVGGLVRTQIGQNEHRSARFGRFEVVVGWLGQRKAKIVVLVNFEVEGWLGPKLAKTSTCMLDLATFEVVGGWLGQKKAQIGLDLVNSEVVRPKENPKRALTHLIWPKRKKTIARVSPSSSRRQCNEEGNPRCCRLFRVRNVPVIRIEIKNERK